MCVSVCVCASPQAWSAIVHSLIPNIKRLEDELLMFCDMCDADEVVLFERATFLVISQAIRKVWSVCVPVVVCVCVLLCRVDVSACVSIVCLCGCECVRPY